MIYSTHLYVWSFDVSLKQRFSGRGWEISFRPPLERDMPHSGKPYNRYEVLLHTRSQAMAEMALSLIHAGLVLNEPSMDVAHYIFTPIPVEDDTSGIAFQSYTSDSVLHANTHVEHRIQKSWLMLC